ncbi:MAG: type I methionyl aminopeptidase [Clostridia bacterium]|nr:type I methionyl aminopeptidase [Clostridia bacterium]
MLYTKSKYEIELMKAAGEILAVLLNTLPEKIKPGVTTKELDKFSESVIMKNGALPSFKGQPGFLGAPDFPASVCASVNDEIIHGIPGNRILHDGDIVSIDVGCSYKGYQGDAARTYVVGECSEEASRLVRVTRECFFEGIKNAVPGKRVIDVSGAVQDHAESNGYSVVREFTGHGIGRELHEDPEVPNYRTNRRGIMFIPGIAIAVEPMICAGDFRTKTDRNGWTVRTADGKLSAHYENTVIVTDGEPIITTLI